MIKTIAVALSLLTVGTASADSNFRSGQYEFVKLAITPENHIEGYYHEVVGEGVTRTCNFFFEGKIKIDDKTYVTTSSDQKVDGVLNNQLNSIYLKIASDHPGCMGSSASEALDGVNLSLLEQKDWIGLGVITKDKVHLHPAPNDLKPSKVYIVKDDVFSIIKLQDGYTFIEYINDDNKSFKGWIKNTNYSNIKVP